MKTRKKRILVVDDEENITLVLRLMFERTKDYEVKVENDSTRALAIAEKFRPDLVLLDVDMPEMGGGELAFRFSNIPSLKSVPVIFLTDSVTKEEVFSAKGTLGGLPFLAKPVNRDEVLGCLRRYLRTAASTEPKSSLIAVDN